MKKKFQIIIYDSSDSSVSKFYFLYQSILLFTAITFTYDINLFLSPLNYGLFAALK